MHITWKRGKREKKFPPRCTPPCAHMAWERPLWLQALIGGSVITLAELGAGLILNVWLKLDIWDYSRLPGNLWGQVCLKYALLWVVLAGTAIVLFDWMRHWLFQEERPHYRWI